MELSIVEIDNNDSRFIKIGVHNGQTMGINRQELGDIITESVKKAMSQHYEDDKLLSVKECTKMIGCSRESVIRYFDAGILVGTYKEGIPRKDGKAPTKTRLISKNSVSKFINNKK